MPAARTLLARWEPGHAGPWLLLTDLSPEAADASWYGLRAWIEQGFTLTKRGDFQWQRTCMTNPDRAARLWLALALAARWRLRVGGEADAAIAVGTLTDLPLPQRRQRAATQIRLVSIVRRGWTSIRAALLAGAPPRLGRFSPGPWPSFAPLLPLTYPCKRGRERG